MAGFTRAERSQRKVRAAIDGPSGSGKTLTSLIMASVFANGQPFAVVDSERSSASLYADLEIDGLTLTFDRMDLTDYSPDGYIKAMNEAADAGYPVLVMDSITHEWNGKGGILQIVDDEQKRNNQRSSYQAWAKGKREHGRFIESMLATPYHLIVTMRSKMEHVLQDDGGKKTVKKMGMEPVQSDGMEYEFDIVADMNLDHELVVSKTRYFELADLVERKPGRKFAQKLLDLASSGTVMKPPERTPEDVAKIVESWAALKARGQKVGIEIPIVDLEKDTAWIQAQYRMGLDAIKEKEAEQGNG
jgi:hypothetical protein